MRILALTMLVLSALAFAASIAMGASNNQNDPGSNNDAEECLGYMVGGACKIDVCNDDGTTRSINYNAFLQGTYDTPPCNVIVEEDPDITVCRGGESVTIKQSARLESDTNPPCGESDPDITVCRGGVATTIKTSARLESDTNPPCGESDPDITVCRAGAVISIKTSERLGTDTAAPCPGNGNTPGGQTPGEAAGGGPVDQGDTPAAGVEYAHDSLAPTAAHKDGPGAGPEFAVAGASDAAAAPVSGSGAAAPVRGELPYTGLGTMQMALLGMMLLGAGSLLWLVGAGNRKDELQAA